MTQPATYPVHPVAELFPVMGDDEIRQLADDIRTNGLVEPIWLYGGQIVDGRNRALACQIAGIEPRFREWSGGSSLLSFVVSQNLHRRHLTSSQKAVIALSALPMLEEEARDRKSRAGASSAPGRPAEKDTPRLEQVSSGMAAQQAADLFGAGRQYVYEAKNLQVSG